MVSRSSAESEYRVIMNITCELVWIRYLLTGFRFAPEGPMRLYYDNQVVHIAEN